MDIEKLNVAKWKELIKKPAEDWTKEDLGEAADALNAYENRAIYFGHSKSFWYVAKQGYFDSESLYKLADWSYYHNKMPKGEATTQIFGQFTNNPFADNKHVYAFKSSAVYKWIKELQNKDPDNFTTKALLKGWVLQYKDDAEDLSVVADELSKKYKSIEAKFAEDDTKKREEKKKADLEEANNWIAANKTKVDEMIKKSLTSGKNSSQFIQLILDLIEIESVESPDKKYGSISNYTDNIELDTKYKACYTGRSGTDHPQDFDVLVSFNITCGKEPYEKIYIHHDSSSWTLGEEGYFGFRLNYKAADLQEEVDHSLETLLYNNYKHFNKIDARLKRAKERKAAILANEKHVRKLKSALYRLQGMVDSGIELDKEDYAEIDAYAKELHSAALREYSSWSSAHDGSDGLAYSMELDKGSAKLVEILTPYAFNLVDVKTNNVELSHKADEHLDDDELVDYITGKCRLEIVASED